MIKEIGSSFYLEKYMEKDASETFIPLNGLCQFTEYYSSCRDSIRMVLKKEKVCKGLALVPPFTCHAVIQPFIEHGMNVLPYIIDEDFRIDIQKTLDAICINDLTVFIFHPYFGFNDQNSTILDNILKDKGVLTIKDRTQNMFSESVCDEADYVVGSIRKWLEVPDGGFLTTNIGPLQNYSEEYRDLVDLSLFAMKKKYRYLRFAEGTDFEYRNAFSKYEDMLDDNQKIYRISKESISICGNYDWDNLNKRRRTNYQVLASGLNKIEQLYMPFPSLLEGVVPFMFPVLVNKDRKELQSYLAQKKIFATAIWRCPDILMNQISESERKIYQQILCFAVDQRYSTSDMERIVESIIEYYKEM